MRRRGISANEIQMKLAKEVSALLAPQSSPEDGRKKVEGVFRVISLYDSIAGKLYSLRALRPPSDPLRQRIEDYMAGISGELLVLSQEERSEGTYAQWLERYRGIWRREMPLFFFTLMFFVASCFLGWNIALSHPALVSVLLPQSLMEEILDHHAWFERIQGNPLLHGLLIAWNNIQVAILSFTLGAVLGLGGLYILCYNGVLFGAIMGYCFINGLHQELTTFVIGHGPLELTIIIASAFGSLLYGRVFYMRPYQMFGFRIRAAAKDSTSIVIGIMAWLVLAACIEVFVSPWNYLTFTQKFLLGITVTALFWLWTFLPTPSNKKSASG